MPSSTRRLIAGFWCTPVLRTTATPFWKLPIRAPACLQNIARISSIAFTGWMPHADASGAVRAWVFRLPAVLSKRTAERPDCAARQLTAAPSGFAFRELELRARAGHRRDAMKKVVGILVMVGAAIVLVLA